MKKLFLFISLAAVVFYSCGKEAKPNEEENDNPAREEEEVIEITSFNLHSTYLLLAQNMTEGLVLQIDDIAPRKAPFSLLKCTVEDESIVSFERDPYGFRLFPKGVGKTKVTISTTSGPADSKVCNVEVMEQAVYDTPILTSISAEKTEFELSDQPSSGGAMQGDKVKVEISLVPEDATLQATEVYTDRPDILYVTPSATGKTITIEAEPNLDNKESVTGTFHVYVKPKRGDAKTLTLTVNVFGHVYGAVFNGLKEGVAGVETIDGELGLNIDKGAEVKILPEILATGPLKSTDKEVVIGLCEAYNDGITPSEEQCIEINEKGVLKATANTVHSTKKFYVAAYQEIKLPLAKFPIQIYDPVEEISINCLTAAYDHIYTIGDKCSFQAAIVPSTARQDIDWVFDEDYLEKVKTEGRYKIELKCIKGTYSGKTLTAKSRNSNKGGNITIQINDLKASDVKVGDWVYYNSSSKSFRVSDGGLRIYENGRFRDDKVSPATTSSSEKVVGVIFNMDVDADNFPVKLAGYNGKHFRVVSLLDGEKWQWSDGKYNVEQIDNAWKACGADDKYGHAPFDGRTNNNASSTYEANLGWLLFNDYVDATHAVKAIYGPTNYAPNNVIAVATQYAKGASGWLLMGTRDARLLGEYFNLIQDNRLKLSGAGFDALGSYYWTCNFPKDEGKADAMEIDKGNVSTTEKSRSDKCATRPIFYL